MKDVVEGEAAAKAGVQAGDIIIRVIKDAASDRFQPIRHFRRSSWWTLNSGACDGDL